MVAWKYLFTFTTTSHIPALVSAMVTSSVTGVIRPGMAILLGMIFNSFADFGGGKTNGNDLVAKVTAVSLYLVGLGFLSWLLHGSSFSLWLAFGELQSRSARDRLYVSLLDKDLAWFDALSEGANALGTRAETRIRELQLATSQPLGFVIQHSVTLLAAFGLAIYSSWDLTLITLATVPFVALFLAWTSARLQLPIERQASDLATAAKHFSNAVKGIDLVKCFNGEHHEKIQYISSIRRAAGWFTKQARISASQIGFVRLAVLSMFVQGFWYGSHLVNVGAKTPAQILTAFWASLISTQTFEQILPQMMVLEKGRAAAADLTRLSSDRSEAGTGTCSYAMVRNEAPLYCEGDIQVENISFAYPAQPDRFVLQNLTLFFPAGETTFLLGSSGSGKSTLSSLLLGFYQLRTGQIRIDGKNVQFCDVKWLRNNITLVHQQTTLFDDTILENVTLGCANPARITQSCLMECLDTAALREHLDTLPSGLQTRVGIGGSAVSGGQRQKIALARARLRDTPILILDEATSALDQKSKTCVLEAIRKWRKGKTTIIITHDLSQIQDGDYIYVLERGQLVREGYGPAFVQRVESHPHNPVPTGHLNNETKTAGGEDGILQSKKPTKSYSQKEPVSTSEEKRIKTAHRRSRISKILVPDIDDPRLDSWQTSTAIAPFVSQLQTFSGSEAAWQPLRGSLNANAIVTSTSNKKGSAILHPRASPTDQFRKEGRKDRGVALRKRNVANVKGNNNDDPKISEQIGHEPANVGRRQIRLHVIFITIWPRLAWRSRMRFILGFLLALVHAACTPVFSWAFSKLLSAFFAPMAERSNLASRYSALVLCVAAVDATASSMMHFLLEVCAQSWIDSTRASVAQRVLSQPRAWFDEDGHDAITLTQSLDRNAEEMRNLLSRFASSMLIALTMAIVGSVWSFILCWKLSLVSLAVLPFFYGVSRTFGKVTSTWESRCNTAAETAGKLLTETIVNIQTIRALAVEEHFHEKHIVATRSALKTGLERAFFSGMFFGLSESATAFATALVFWYGSFLAGTGIYEVQTIISVFTIFLFSMNNASALLSFTPQISSSRDTASRLIRLSKLPCPGSRKHRGGRRLVSIPAGVSFSNVTFAYPHRPSFPVLSGLKLRIPLQSSVALVGPSGCGKSTLALLLMGLYNVKPYSNLGGSETTSRSQDRRTTPPISFGELALSEIDLTSLRKLIAFVPQQSFIFPATVAENIAYGVPADSELAGPASVERVARLACLDDFVSSLPDGYRTVIGEGGIGLSGGQAQRLSIARALVRRPEIVVLDEPTSNLDAENAEAIAEMLRRLVAREGKTVIVVTHSSEMMRAMGRVVVLGEGRVQEDGSWEGLIQKEGGKLRELLRHQQETS